MSTEKTSKIVKKRNWAFVLYPESAPSDWLEQLQKKGVIAAISPLHDKDLDPNGEPKKAHYHVLMAYGGPTSFNVIKGITEELGQPIPQAVEQLKGYYRYLTHKDNPEKAQYAPEDIQTINGFNISELTELTKSELFEIKKILIDFICDNMIVEYADLIEALKSQQMYAELDVSMSNTMFFNSYIKSRKHRKDGALGRWN